MSSNLLYLLIILTICLGIGAMGFGSEEHPYVQLERVYDSSEVPTLSAVEGYWSGRCVNQSLMTPQPALFVFKLTHNPKYFPPNFSSMSYWTESGSPDQFDAYTPYQIESDPVLSKWLSEEQWRPVQPAPSEWTNERVIPDSHLEQRSLRVDYSEFSSRLILRISEYVSRAVTWYCYFDNRLWDQSKLLIGKTGPLENEYFQLVNQFSEKWFSKFRIENLGDESVVLRGLNWESPGGVVSTVSPDVKISPNTSHSFWVKGYDSFQFTKMGFELLGSTKGLLITGLPLN